MSTKQLGWIPLLGLTLITCLAEHTYGIRRVASLDKLPDIKCVRRVMSQSEGVRSVDDLYPTSLGGTLWSFRYEGNGFRANLTIRRERDDTFKFLHERLSINKKPSQAEVDRTLTVMRSVEDRLIHVCEMRELKETSQKCMDIRCDEVP